MLRILLRLCVFVCLSLWSHIGLAQEQQKPLMGSEASPEVVAPPPDAQTAEPAIIGGSDGIYQILVIGDSLAGGLGAGITRVAEGDARFEVINRFNELSGLARADFYDWPDALSKIVAAKPVDAVVVLVGVNDRREFRDGNVRHAFKTPEWEKGYSATVDRLIDAVAAANAKLFWVSIPPMADVGFDTDMRFLADIHRNRVSAKQGNFVDVRPFFLAADGSYIDRGPDDTGTLRKLRSRDGITFFKQGNNRFGQLVLGAIKSLGLQDSPAPAAATAPAADPSNQPVGANNPVPKDPPTLGQDGLDGEQLTFKADAVAMRAPDAKPSEEKAGSSDQQVKLVARKGSSSERLMVQGLPPQAPAGRFDDFSVPAAE
jgi:uncharacterized protein